MNGTEHSATMRLFPQKVLLISNEFSGAAFY